MWSKERLLKAKRNIHFASVSLPDEYAVDSPEIFPHWLPDTQYNLGVRICYNDKLYKVNQTHTSQADWLPGETPALYTEITLPGEIGIWKQPTGAHDVYNTGDKVYYPDKYGKIYVSNCDNNSWEPTVYGWDLL